MTCAEALCRSAGFARVKREYVSERRAGFTCRRLWEPVPANPAPPPLLYSAVNNRTNDVQFHLGKDEYICVYFRSDAPDLTRDRLRIEIDGLGAPVLILVNLRAEEWQANLRVPPGLAPGDHQVRLRTVESSYSNSFTIIVEPPGETGKARPRTHESPAVTAAPPQIYAVSNGMTESDVFYGHRNEYVCCRFRTAETGLDRDSVILMIGEMEQPVAFLTDLGDGGWQANSRLPGGLTEGRQPVRVRTIHSPWSESRDVFFRPSAT